MLVKLTEQEQGELGVKLSAYVQAGVDTKGRMPSWWEQVQRMHRNERPVSADPWGSYPDDPGYTQFHMPFSQPREDMLVAQVCTVINKQQPYMLATEGVDEYTGDAMQTLGHRVWQDAKFEDRTRKAGWVCADIDMAIWRMSSTDRNNRPAIQFDIIPPENFICFPATPDGITASVCVGNQIYRRRKEITDKQAAKTYYPTTVPQGDDPQGEDLSGAFRHAGVDLDVSGPDPAADSMVEIYDLNVKLQLKDDKAERWYHALIAYSTQNLLLLEPMAYSMPTYFVGKFVGDVRQFWSGTSVGRNLYGLQDGFNKLHSALYAGGMTSAMPAMIGPPLDSGEKFTKYKWGDYIETSEPVQPFSPTIRFVGQPIVEQIQMLEQTGDQVARISQNTQGAQATGQTTATEQSIIAAGVAVGLEEYIANFSEPFPDMMRLTFEMIAERFSEFEAAYGQPVQPPMDDEGMGGVPAMPMDPGTRQ